MRDEFEEAGMTSCLVDSNVEENDLLEKLSTDRLTLVDSVTHVLVGFDSKFSHCKGEYFVIKKIKFLIIIRFKLDTFAATLNKVLNW